MQTRFGLGEERYRYARPTDIEAITTLLADPEVGRWLWFVPATAASLRAYFQRHIDTQWQSLADGVPPSVAIFIVEDADGTSMGHAAVMAVEGSADGFEISLQLLSQLWRRGIGTRVAEFLIAWAARQCAAHRVQAGCLEGNVAADKLMTKLGLVHEGTRPEFRRKGDQRCTERQYGSPIAALDPALLQRASAAANFDD